MRKAALAAVAVVTVLGAGMPPATAATSATPPVTAYQLPFRCGQSWTGTTRPDHSPSPNAIDFTRSHDFGKSVLAAAAGTVVVARNLGNVSYGRYVVIDHGNGESTLYAHLSSIWVTVGQSIDQGQVLGRVGASGNATGAHLHFEERLDGTDVPPYFNGAAYQFDSSIASANCVDVPIAGDWNGDGTTDIGVYRRGKGQGRFLELLNGVTTKVAFAPSIDNPVLGDWNADGTSDLGVHNVATRSILSRSSDGTVTSTTLGARRDKIVAGDFAGDGTTQMAVYRPRTGSFGLLDSSGKMVWTQLGTTADLPVVGDWNGDGTTDFGVYDPATATWTLRYVDSTGVAWVAQRTFGQPGDLPVVGDWNGDGTTDVGVWDPATADWTLDQTDPASQSPSPGTTVSSSGLVFGHPR